MADVSNGFGWEAVEAIATSLAALVAIATLPLILRQIRLGQRAHNEALIEAGVQRYLQFRCELYDLDVKRSTREQFSWADLGQLRMAAATFEMLYPTVILMIQLGSDRRADQLKAYCMRDFDHLVAVVRYVQEKLPQIAEAAVEELQQILVAAFEEVGGTDEEKAEHLAAIKSGDKDRALALYSAARTRHYFAQGLSADQYVSMREKEKREKSDPIEVVRRVGGNHNNVALVQYWTEELDELLEHLEQMREHIQSDLGGAGRA